MTTNSTAKYFYATGRRKTAVARIRMLPGNGSGGIVVNGKPLDDYFGGRKIHSMVIHQPLTLTSKTGVYNITVKVLGGGTSGQAGAIRHGIARALVQSDETLRSSLKRAGLLTRDSRVKERKKVGLKRARKAPQYTKR